MTRNLPTTAGALCAAAATAHLYSLRHAFANQWNIICYIMFVCYLLHYWLKIQQKNDKRRSTLLQNKSYVTYSSFRLGIMIIIIIIIINLALNASLTCVDWLIFRRLVAHQSMMLSVSGTSACIEPFFIYSKWLLHFYLYLSIIQSLLVSVGYSSCHILTDAVECFRMSLKYPFILPPCLFAMTPVAPRPPVVSTVTVASSASFSGFPVPPGESTVLRMRLRTLLTCCVSGVHSHVSMMLRVRAEDQVSNTLNYTEYIDQTWYASKMLHATSLSQTINSQFDCSTTDWILPSFLTEWASLLYQPRDRLLHCRL